MKSSRHHLIAGAVLAVGAGLVAVPVGVAAGVASTSGAEAAHGPDLAVVQAYVAGAARSAELGESLTFVFSARDNGPGPADLAIDLRTIRGIDRDGVATRLSCVLPNGFVIEPDGDFCEPGPLRPGQRAASLVFTGDVTGLSDIVVRACATNLSGTPDPKPGNNCRTLRVALA
jgi:hypothetical protein